MDKETVIKDFFAMIDTKDKGAIREAFSVYIDNLARDWIINEKLAREIYIDDYDINVFIY